MTHSLTGTISMADKHSGECEHCMWTTPCFMHTLAMAQQRCSIPRSLGGGVCRCLCCKSARPKGQTLPKSHPVLTTHYCITPFCHVGDCPRPQSPAFPQHFCFSSSFITLLSCFSLLAAADVDRLTILGWNIGLF